MNELLSKAKFVFGYDRVTTRAMGAVPLDPPPTFRRPSEANDDGRGDAPLPRLPSPLLPGLIANHDAH